MARVSATSSFRVLMLHGDAADESLMRMLLDASGWSAHTSVEFVCRSAPHECAPKPELFAAFAERGLYDKERYCTWGLHAGEQTAPGLIARSVAHVQRLLIDENCDGVGGICDGAIIAALAALQTPSVKLFINACAGPLSMVRRYIDEIPQLSSAKVTVPSIHLLSFSDDVFTFSELSEVPGVCEGGMVHLHAQGHAFPLLSPAMDDGLHVAVALARGVSSAGGGEHPRGTPPAPKDSLDLLAAMSAGGMSERDASRGHINFAVLSLVIYHHARLKFLTTRLQAVTPADKQALFVLESFVDVAMPIAIALLGVDARNAERTKPFLARVGTLAFLIWTFTLSALPTHFENLLDARLWPTVSSKTEYTFTAERLVTPMWFLYALVLWEIASELARRVRLASLVPAIALAFHFYFHSSGSEKWYVPGRDGGLVKINFGLDAPGHPWAAWASVVNPLQGWTVQTTIARTVTYWWLYAFAPVLLPPQFPVVLPLERLIRSPRAARLLWASAAFILLGQTARETIAALGKGLGGSAKPSAYLDTWFKGFMSYGCVPSVQPYDACKRHNASAGQWTFTAFTQDATSCAMQFVILVGIGALAPRSASPLAKAGHMAIVILVLHEYVLSLLDYPTAQLLANVTTAFRVPVWVLILLACMTLTFGIAQFAMMLAFVAGAASDLISTGLAHPIRLAMNLGRWLYARGQRKGSRGSRKSMPPGSSDERTGRRLTRDSEPSEDEFDDDDDVRRPSEVAERRRLTREDSDDDDDDDHEGDGHGPSTTGKPSEERVRLSRDFDEPTPVKATLATNPILGRVLSMDVKPIRRLVIGVLVVGSLNSMMRYDTAQQRAAWTEDQRVAAWKRANGPQPSIPVVAAVSVAPTSAVPPAAVAVATTPDAPPAASTTVVAASTVAPGPATPTASSGCQAKDTGPVDFHQNTNLAPGRRTCELRTKPVGTGAKASDNCNKQCYANPECKGFVMAFEPKQNRIKCYLKKCNKPLQPVKGDTRANSSIITGEHMPCRAREDMG